jgi:anti-sigma factor RsiW
MCDVSGKLIAWMDDELAENEAANVERHVRDCAECRSRVEAFGEVSRLIVAYCDGATEAERHRKLRLWMPALAGTVAVAALLLITFRPAAVKPIPVVLRAATPAPVLVPEVAAAPTKVVAKTVHRHRQGVTPRNPNPDWAFANPAFQIVIPADAMFAPGAGPEGTIFRADLSMASDGSVQGLRLLQ